jgi:hypothetical protein
MNFISNIMSNIPANILMNPSLSRKVSQLTSFLRNRFPDLLYFIFMPFSDSKIHSYSITSYHKFITFKIFINFYLREQICKR